MKFSSVKRKTCVVKMLSSLYVCVCCFSKINKKKKETMNICMQISSR